MDQDSTRPESAAEPGAVEGPAETAEEGPAGDVAGGLTDEDLQALRELGHPVAPEPVQELLAPARRGRDLAVLAGEGSGKEALYALTASARLRPESLDLQALVLTPTRETSGRVCRYLYELAGPSGIHALAWSDDVADAGDERPVAQVVAGRPESLMTAIRAGRLGIDDLALLILDGVAALRDTDPSGALDEIIDTAGADVQVVAVSDRPDPDFGELAERRLSRARKWPREFFGDGELPEPSGAAVAWGSAAGFEERLDLLARGLRAAVPDEPVEVLVHCSGQEEARRVAGALAGRGFHIASEAGEPGVGVAWGEDESPEGGIAAWFGLPSGLPGLRRTAGAAARTVVVVSPPEAPQLRILARRAGWPLETIPESLPEGPREEIARFREEIAERADRVEKSTELLVLEPVVESRGFPPVTAALAAWVRELLRQEGDASGTEARAPEADRGAPPKARDRGGDRRGGGREPDRGARGRERRGRRETPSPPWTRLFIPVGERDDVRPGDLVGAITGETDAVGGQIGKIDIRDSYSLVEVESGIADHVIDGLSGATIRGRRVEVRRDRNA